MAAPLQRRVPSPATYKRGGSRVQPHWQVALHNVYIQEKTLSNPGIIFSDNKCIARHYFVNKNSQDTDKVYKNNEIRTTINTYRLSISY